MKNGVVNTRYNFRIEFPLNNWEDGETAKIVFSRLDEESPVIVGLHDKNGTIEYEHCRDLKTAFQFAGYLVIRYGLDGPIAQG